MNRYLMIILIFFIGKDLFAQSVGTEWIESVTPPVSFPNYEDSGDSARRYTFQDTQYVTIPYVHSVLPATETRGANGYLSFVDGNNETSMIWVAGDISSVSSIIPYVLIGSATTELQWVVMYNASDISESGISESDLSEAVEQVRIYQESFVTASDSVSWVFELPEDIRVDRDWEPFGGTLGGYSFKPGIGAGDYPGEDGTLFVTVQTGFIPADTKGELLYRYSAVSGHVSTPTGQSPDFPIRYLEQGGLGWR